MKEKVSNGIFMALIINMVYAKAIGLTQGSIAREVGADMWISTIFSSLQGIVIMLLTVFVIRKAPTLNLFEQSELLIGKWFSKIICLLTFLFFLGASGAAFTTFVYHLKDYFLPDAPTYLFVLAGFIVAVFALFHGIEVIGRLALIGVFFIIMLNGLIILGSMSEFDIRELMPIMGNGFIADLWASRYNNTDWAMATMMAGIILPKVKDHTTWGKSGSFGIIIGGLFVVLWPILEAGVLSAEVTGQYIISCMQMARSAEIGVFIHRYELIMIAFFSLSLLTQLIMIFYCATISIQSLFGLKSMKRSIIPVSLILSLFGYWIVIDHNRAISYIETDWVILSLSLAAGIPLLLLFLGFLFRKRLKKPTVDSLEA